VPLFGPFVNVCIKLTIFRWMIPQQCRLPLPLVCVSVGVWKRKNNNTASQNCCEHIQKREGRAVQFTVSDMQWELGVKTTKNHNYCNTKENHNGDFEWSQVIQREIQPFTWSKKISYTTKHTPCVLFQLPSASVSAQTGIHTNQIKISNKKIKTTTRTGLNHTIIKN